MAGAAAYCGSVIRHVGESADCENRAGTVCRLISRIAKSANSPSASLKRRKFVEKKINPPGDIRAASRMSNWTWSR